MLASSDSVLLAHDALCSSLLLSSSPTLQSSDIKINGHAKAKRLLREISDDDKPTEKHFDFGRSIKVDVGPEWGKFKNYCLAHGKKYVNFEAAFRNWLANSVNMNGGKR